MRIIKVKSSTGIKVIKELNYKYKFEINRDYEVLLKDNNTEIYELTDKKRIIGFSGLIHNDWNETLHVLNIFIDPEFRNKGYGKYIINFLINKAKRMDKYRCIIAEAPAKDYIYKFYAKLGFRKCGYNDRYYTNENNGDIAIFMSYDLE